jgi:hypothetical protein
MASFFFHDLSEKRNYTGVLGENRLPFLLLAVRGA